MSELLDIDFTTDATRTALVVGLRGLGAEIAKNLVLAGVQSIALFDPEPVNEHDQGSQFLLRPSDIGRPRAAASLPRLAALNPHVSVRDLGRAQGDEVTADLLKEFQVVILTDRALATQLAINAWARAQGVPFLSAETHGIFGSVFADFGPAYTFFASPFDTTVHGQVAQITPDGEGKTACTCECKHHLADGDYVKFRDRPMDPARRVAVVDEQTFVLDGSVEGRMFEKVTMPETIDFLSLTAWKDGHSLMDPAFVVVDPAKGAATLHAGFRALHAFAAEHSRLPSAADADEVLALARALNADVDASAIAELASQAGAELAPMAAVIGALVAQEALKALSRTHRPIVQHLYLDALEALPSTLPTDRSAAADSRYASQLAVFGPDFQRKISQHRQFVVGASAMGQELLKNFATMGLGGVHITDSWTVEKDDVLSRSQVLVREGDAGKSRSDVAVKAVLDSMNPGLEGRVVAHTERFDGHTEHIFTEEFFADVDGVTSAVENRSAGAFAAFHCVWAQKPLLVARTGRVQPLVPHVTDSLDARQWAAAQTRELPGEECPQSDFPYAVEQCVAWAQLLFEGAFAESFESTAPQTVEDCVRWARLQFEEHFREDVEELLEDCPAGTKTADGRPFFAGPRHAPVPLTFDADDELHLDFILSAANIHAVCYGIEITSDRARIKALAAGVDVAALGEDEEDEGEREEDEDDDNEGEEEQDESYAGEPTGVKFNLHDGNYHLDFVVAAANLRARCFGIPPIDRYMVKRFLLGTFPEIVTATALAAGLACLELYKIIDEKKTLADYKSGFLDLESPGLALLLSEPAAPKTEKYGDTEWTLWDRFEFPRDLTLRELVERFKAEHNLTATLVFRGINAQRQLAKKMSELVAKPLPPHVTALHLNVMVEDASGDIIDIPPVVVRI
ncbi:hypothetical protein AURDEDRAFT_176658 [Auricularia subglabra TFB-10046 SS5]|uniref:Ubiquitin-activating enzyme E1 C-terminal domain-containing protein n=1 Tax=Auricularia subglabra (strain TFB-10046 / SS5) TaxID=717982 RepID=J0LCP9_AURST|nr:hypothetical protein AURDEDRAFT_176658 [Auricularia subglabra TFB-10046 SS5]